jgi:hypothetical protein
VEHRDAGGAAACQERKAPLNERPRVWAEARSREEIALHVDQEQGSAHPPFRHADSVAAGRESLS